MSVKHVEIGTAQSAKCPVCEAEENRVMEEANGYTIHLCAVCGLQYAWPLELPADFYEKVWSCASLQNEADYGERIKRLRQGEILRFSHPFYRKAIQILQRLCPRESTILDVGCGDGRFMMLLEKAGFKPVGCDVASEPVHLLQRLGLRVYCGSVTDYPAGWEAPVAVTVFEVLEHLPNPVGFLGDIRKQFPKAVLIASVPSPLRPAAKFRRHEPFDYPPHHLLRWSLHALEIAFKRAGYQKIRFEHFPVKGSEIPLRLGLAKRFDLTVGRISHNDQFRVFSILAGRSKDILLFPIVKMLQALGFRGGSVLVLANPN